MYQIKDGKSQFLDLFFSLNGDEKKDFFKKVKNSGDYPSIWINAIKTIDRNSKKSTSNIKSILIDQLSHLGLDTEVKVRLLFSDLLSELKFFLISRQSAKNTHMEELCYLKILQDKKLDRLYQNQLSNVEKMIDSKSDWNEEKFYTKFKLESQKFQHDTGKNRFDNSRIQELVQNFEYYVLLEKLKIYLEHLSVLHFSKEGSVFNELENTIHQERKKDWSSIPEIHIYFIAVKLFTEFDNDDHYIVYKSLLQKYFKYWTKETSKMLFPLALNYCIKKINLSIAQYFEEALSLYEHGVDYQWILENGVMNQVTYKNIVSLCIKMKEYDLAEHLLIKYKPLVSQINRESIYQFNQSRVLKEKGDIKGALFLLNTNRYKDPLIELHARVELVKIYFELNEENLFSNQIFSSQRFLKKQSSFGYHKNYYINFFNIALSIYALNNQAITEKKKSSLLKRIKNEDTIIEKNWLIKMVMRLKL